MRVFHDWEFLEDGVTIAPISVGMVAEDGREYYAVVSEISVKHVMEHDWLRENVVPSLPIVRHDGMQLLKRPYLDRSEPAVKTTDQIRDEVRRFLLATPDLELWGWYSAYDHVCLAQLFGRMIDLPAGVPMWTSDLQQEIYRLCVDPDDLPEQTGRRHNALDDARRMAKIAAYLDEVGQ